MALGDGSAWDETKPTDATVAIQIDDYNRDLRKGISARMRFEHEWPASQSATSEGGKHKFITLQDQGAKPTVSGTQTTAIYEKTNNLFFENSGGVEIQIVAGTAVGDGKVLITATDTAANYLLSKCDTTSIGLINTTAGAQLLGAIALPATKVYDSGWFVATKAGSYTKTHGLGTEALVSQLYWAAGTGGGAVYECDLKWADNSNVRGGNVVDISISTCIVQAGVHGVMSYLTAAGTLVNVDTGFYKLIMVAID